MQLFFLYKLYREADSGKPLVFYSQELSRNFKNDNDPFGRRHLIKCFTPSNFEAAADTSLEMKFNDTILAHKKDIPDYSPLTDIHSDTMNLFMDDDTATFLSDIGVNIDGMQDDFQSIESIGATPYMEDISFDAAIIKKELASVQGKFMQIKQVMADDFNEYADPTTLSDEDFEKVLARHKVSEKYVQSYLSYKEKISILETKLKEVNTAIFSETKSKITLPKLIEENFNGSKRT